MIVLNNIRFQPSFKLNWQSRPVRTGDDDDNQKAAGLSDKISNGGHDSLPRIKMQKEILKRNTEKKVLCVL